MDVDHTYTKQGKEEIYSSLNNMNVKNSLIEKNSNILIEDINKEGDFYNNYSEKIYSLYDNLMHHISEINTTWSKRISLILLCYGILFLTYRFTLYLFLIKYKIEPIMYLLLLAFSTYIIERLAMMKLTDWSNNKLNQLKNNITQTDVKGKNDIKLLNNKNRINQLVVMTKEIVGISALFSGKIDRLLNYLDHQNISKRIKNSVIVCCKRYNLIDRNITVNQIIEPSFELKNEQDLRLFYLNKYSNIFNINTNILKLLYYDYIGDYELLNISWDEIKENYSLITIINNLKNLNLINVENVNDDVIKFLLYNMPTFSLNSLNNSIRNYRKFKDIIEIYLEGAYEENMTDNLISFDYEIIYDGTFNYYLEDYNLKFYYNIIKKYITNVINISQKPHDEYILNTLIGLISAKKYPWLINTSCLEISINERSVNLIFIYQRLKENRDSEVTFFEALSASDDFIKRQMSDYKIVRDDMMLDLQAGKWINNSETVLRRKFDYIKNMLYSIDVSKKKFKSIKRIFSSYTSENTIMHSIDSRTIIAYVINGKHKPKGGNVMPMIDKLKETPGYYFKKFTNSSRIGILPPKTDFLTFSNKFENDIKKISEDVVGNIVIQRFSTSEHNTKQVVLGGEYEPPWITIRQLATQHLSPDQLRVVFSYGELIDDSFLNRPIIEILGSYIHNNYRVNEKSINSILSKKDIIPVILDSYNCNDLRDFTVYLNKYQNKNKMINDLNTIFSNNYSSFESTLIENLVTEFIDVLENYYHAYGELELEYLNK